MKVLAVIIILLVTGCGSAATNTPASTPASTAEAEAFVPTLGARMEIRSRAYTVVVASSVYDCASRDCQEIGEVTDGQVVTVTAAINGEVVEADNGLWYEIEWRDVPGYVYSPGIVEGVVAEPTTVVTQAPTEVVFLAFDRDEYINALRIGLIPYIEQGLGNVGMTDDDGEDRTAMINYTLDGTEVTTQLLDVFDAYAQAIRNHELDMDAGTIVVWIDEDVIIQRVTAQVPDIQSWYRNDLTDEEFQSRWAVVDLVATREARATASAQP